jgi:copper chaperone
MSENIKKLNVEGMSCSHCERAIKNALSELNGVSDIEVDLDGNTVTVKYDEDLVTVINLKEVIEDVGYDVV